jgi:hypothetical protein
MIVEVMLLCGISVTRVSGEMRLKAALLVPSKTAEAPSKFLPVISTREPSGPLVGEIWKISGRVDCAITTAERVEISAPIVVFAIRFPVFTPAASGASTGAWTPAPTLSDVICSWLASNCVIAAMNSRIGASCTGPLSPVYWSVLEAQSYDD